MGSSSSKSAPSSSSSAAGGRRTRSKAHRVLQSSCLGTTSRSRRFDDNAGDQVCDDRGKENVSNFRSRNHSGADLHQGKIGCYGKFKVGQSDELPCISSNAEIREWGQANVTDTASAIGSSSARAASTQSMNPSNRFLSRFSFVPGNMSFRLSRANSLGSSESYPISSTNLMLNNEDDVNLQRGTASGFVDRDYRGQGIEQIPVSLVSDIRASALCCEEASGKLRLRSQAGFPINSRDDQASSCPQDAGRNGSGCGLGIDANLCSPRILSEMESVGARVSDRNVGGREPIERNVRFSRTRSVGRLRDRVLRRSSDISFCPVQQVEEVRDADRGSEARAWAGQTRTISSEASEVASSNSSAFPSSNVSSSLFGIQDYQIETSRSREPRYHDLLEHRSNFLERRRRIRSQVRALQRLGNRFDNLSGHERNCILSGQHRTGRCTCRNSNRDPHLNDDTSARASISRIVMLAEALFEVLDEIHQQSVVLSSRPSVSSIGSVPAPSEAVESLPVKTYTKLQKHQNEEVAQCYICLVEYEEGDRMRVLPCQHEFHKTCVDKWLKEIHRVCPLCRGDICRSDSLPAEN